MIINGTVASIAAIIVILRVISRTFIVKMVGLDDWIMVVATIFTILNVVVEGLGRPLYSLFGYPISYCVVNRGQPWNRKAQMGSQPSRRAAYSEGIGENNNQKKRANQCDNLARTCDSHLLYSDQRFDQGINLSTISARVP